MSALLRPNAPSDVEVVVFTFAAASGHQPAPIQALARRSAEANGRPCGMAHAGVPTLRPSDAGQAHRKGVYGWQSAELARPISS